MDSVIEASIIEVHEAVKLAAALQNLGPLWCPDLPKVDVIMFKWTLFDTSAKYVFIEYPSIFHEYLLNIYSVV